MSTRSNIAALFSDGVYRKVYCHFDGYLRGVGCRLAQNYTTQVAVEQLVSGGDMSVLGERCDKPAGHSYASPTEGYTVYYGRDSGEDNVGAVTCADRDEAAEVDQEYLYLWEHGQWLVSYTRYDDDNDVEVVLQPLVTELVRERILDAVS